MRRSIAALALIRREENGRPRWLAQWNPNWKAYSFVGGHKRAEESFRECMVREIGEELGLEEGTDFVMAGAPAAHLEYNAWSHGAREETTYTMELFDVQLEPSARAAIEANPANRWLSEDEVRTGRSADGRPVSETVSLILTKAQILPG